MTLCPSQVASMREMLNSSLLLLILRAMIKGQKDSKQGEGGDKWMDNQSWREKALTAFPSSQFCVFQQCSEQPAASQGWVPRTMSCEPRGKNRPIESWNAQLLLACRVWCVEYFCFFTAQLSNDFLPAALFTKVSLSD